MRRRLFTIASAASLLLCVVTLIAWLLSFFAFAPFGQFWTTSWGGNGDGYKGRGWIALDGSIHLLRDDRTMDPPPTSRGDRYRHSGIEPVPGVHLWPTRLGFVYASHISRWRERGWGQQVGLKRQRTDINQQLSFPIWLPAIVLAIPPAAWLFAAMRSGRLRRCGLCPSCGYDLRASPRRCPECGAAVTGAA